MIVACFKVPMSYFPWQTDENKNLLEELKPEWRFEPGTCRIRSRSVNRYTAPLEVSLANGLLLAVCLSVSLSFTRAQPVRTAVLTSAPASLPFWEAHVLYSSFSQVANCLNNSSILFRCLYFVAFPVMLCRPIPNFAYNIWSFNGDWMQWSVLGVSDELSYSALDLTPVVQSSSPETLHNITVWRNFSR
jgi:hypothetical protein